MICLLNNNYRRKKNEIKKIKNIKLFVTDCDWVLKDDGLYYYNNGLTADWDLNSDKAR